MIVNAKCPDCGKFFKTRYWFNYHIWNCHPKLVDAAIINSNAVAQ